VFFGGAKTEPYPITVLNTDDLSISKEFVISKPGAWWISSTKGENLFWSDTPSDALFWNSTARKQTSLKGFTLSTVDEILFSSDGRQAVVVRNTGEAESWDMDAGTKVQSLDLPAKARFAQLSLDGNAIHRARADVRFGFTELGGGLFNAISSLWYAS
jgi:hypothetical protein